MPGNGDGVSETRQVCRSETGECEERMERRDRDRASEPHGTSPRAAPNVRRAAGCTELKSQPCGLQPALLGPSLTRDACSPDHLRPREPEPKDKASGEDAPNRDRQQVRVRCADPAHLERF